MRGNLLSPETVLEFVLSIIKVLGASLCREKYLDNKEVNLPSSSSLSKHLATGLSQCGLSRCGTYSAYALPLHQEVTAPKRLKSLSTSPIFKLNCIFSKSTVLVIIV